MSRIAAIDTAIRWQIATDNKAMQLTDILDTQYNSDEAVERFLLGVSNRLRQRSALVQQIDDAIVKRIDAGTDFFERVRHESPLSTTLLFSASFRHTVSSGSMRRHVKASGPARTHEPPARRAA